MMTPEQWSQVKEVFHAAAALAPDERQTFIRGHCNGDEEMLHELQLLLESHDEAEDFIERPALASASEILTTDGKDFWTGRTIGHYRVLHEIGRGGMGTVLLAVRADDQFKKRVAIKVLRRGMDSEDILRRFRNERQILASLEHPFIARLFDGGMTEDGLPYFVMEYIEGKPVDKYADEQQLSTKERLQLFQKMCEAVQYAHQNLIIHRDLKPSNILINSEGMPKLLDFGIAKVLTPDSSVSERELTRTEARVLTPDYASPEQVRGLRVTTATDVYSLGVILYELLTGAKPYKLKDRSFEELSRAICDSQPSKPSEMRSEPRSVGVAGGLSRDVQPPVTAGGFDLKALRGDLDNIVLMALRKEPQRRYESAAQFSADIQRYLDGLPVTAHKDTFAYRASKFVGRNRIAVAAAGLIVVTLLGGILATTWQARRARAHARLADVKSDEAQKALAKTEKINRFMQSVFSYANPAWFGRAGGRRDMSVLEAMRDIEKRIDTEFKDEPDLRADVYQQIGDSYRTQGLPDDAERNLRKALSLRLELYGDDNAKVAESMFILSGVRHLQDDYAEHERLLTKALSIQRRHPDEGNNLPYMMADYANLILSYSKNDYAGALALGNEALAEFRRRYGDGHFMVGLTQSVLIRNYAYLGDYAQVEALAPIVQKHFNQQPPVLWPILETDAFLKTNKGDYPAADNAIEQMLEQAQSRDAGPYMMPAVHVAQSFLAYRQGDYAQAEVYAERALATAQASGLTNYSNIYVLAPSLNKLGQAKRAETLLLKEIERLKQSEQVFNIAKLKSVLGESFTAQRRFAEAETVLREAYETQKARVLPQEFHFGETRQRLAALYQAWGKPDKARE